jgi:methylamine dehydrogenase accessory protein MauD
MEGIWLASYLVLWVLMGLLAFVVIGLMRQIGELRLRVGEEREVGIAVGNEAPLFQGEGLDGTVDLKTMVGDRLLVLFVHPTCPPCKELFASLNGEPEQIEKLGVRMVLVSGGSREQNREMVEEFSLSCPLVIQQEREIADLYGSSWTPFGFVVDKAGLVAGKGVVNNVDVLGELLATDATDGSLPKNGSA